MKRTKTIIAAISRTLLGLVFIFSGAVKAIDPLGTVYKIEDYLKAFEGFFTNLLPAAEAAAWVLIVLELLLGVCMVLNVRTKCTSWIALLFYCVMTPLTLYIALTNPVSDCGCFGDAIVLTNWQTFWKNVVLIVLAIILVALRKSTHPLWRGWMELVIATTTIAAAISFMTWTKQHLPIKDFRPYKIGNHLPTIMEDYEPDQYEYTYICAKDSVEQAFTAENYPDSTWTLVRYASKLIQKGYESPIHDFEIINAYGDDLTWDILESEEPVTLVIMYDLAKADKSQMTKVEELYYAAQQYITSEEEEVIESCDSITNDSTYSENTEYSEITYNTNFYIITGSNTDEFVVEYPALSECICTCDPVTLKTIVRANPGVIVLKDGIVIDKYNLKNK
ncbi:MAG: DoxX family protein [Paludibacteraceae bacterium]|nr:DoxX family protein [Paludibacteraceae bacterium]